MSKAEKAARWAVAKKILVAKGITYKLLGDLFEIAETVGLEKEEALLAFFSDGLRASIGTAKLNGIKMDIRAWADMVANEMYGEEA